jgi:tetratricopeptide (TPR) repeat protein
MGRTKEVMEEVEKAHALDPLSPIITNAVGWMNVNDGRLDEAIVVYDKLVENEPAYAGSYTSRAFCFALKGMKERAYADLETWRELSRDEDAYKASLALLYGWFGEKEKALPMVEELIQKVGKSSVWEQSIAACYAVLGDRDEFFKWIDGAISAKRIGVAEFRSLPFYDKVREDPRFPEIFKKLGLPY